MKKGIYFANSNLSKNEFYADLFSSFIYFSSIENGESLYPQPKIYPSISNSILQPRSEFLDEHFDSTNDPKLMTPPGALLDLILSNTGIN